MKITIQDVITFEFEFSPRDLKKAWSATRGLFTSKTSFTNYFDVLSPHKADYVIYELGLRPKVPLVDLLYLEFLHNLVASDRAEKILVFPSKDLTAPSQETKDLHEFTERVFSIFSKHKNRIEVIDLFAVAPPAQHLLSTDFLQSIKFIGSEEFLAIARNDLNLSIRGFGDFNKYHPEDSRLLSTFVHLVRGWLISDYLKRQGIIDGSSVNLGFIIWETEVDKLGFFYRISAQNEGMVLTPIMGRTVFASKREPIPTFGPKALNVFDSLPDLIWKLSSKTDKEIRRYVRITRTILEENYEKTKEPVNASEKGREIFRQQKLSQRPKLESVGGLTKTGYAALFLIDKLREQYGT